MPCSKRKPYLIFKKASASKTTELLRRPYLDSAFGGGSNSLLVHGAEFPAVMDLLLDRCGLLVGKLLVFEHCGAIVSICPIRLCTCV